MVRAPLWQVAEKGKPVQKLLGQEPTKSRVVPPAAGVTGDFKTVEQQDPLLSSVVRRGVVRRGGCDGSCLGVAARPCVWLVAGLCLLVVDEEVVIHTAVVGCLLRFLCVHLDAVL